MTGIAAYNIDKSTYPIGTGSAGALCASGAELSQYVPKFPVDPISTSTLTCGSTGGYGYGTGMVSGTVSFAVSSFFENPVWGNTGAISTFQGHWVTTLSQIDLMKKGAAGAFSGYVVRN